MKKIRARIRITGSVQGVGFRYFVHHNAVNLGVNGRVRNTSGGAVEAVFEGEEDAVRRLAGLCGEGPRGADVKSTEAEYEEPRGEFKEFRIEP